MGNASNLAVTLLLFGAVMGTSSAQAQTPAEGAYEQLSPGNQKIARALFDAQVKPSTTTAPTTSRTSGTSTKPLTLDQIAAMKQSGQGWGQVFQSLKAQGLVQDKNLGQVVSRANRTWTSGVVTTAANRAYPVTRPAHAVKSQTDDGTSASPSMNHGGGNGNAALAGSAGSGNAGGMSHAGGNSK